MGANENTGSQQACEHKDLHGISRFWRYYIKHKIITKETVNCIPHLASSGFISFDFTPEK